MLKKNGGFMKYEFVYTFIIYNQYPFSDSGIKARWELDSRNIQGIIFETDKGYRVITIGCNRKKVEHLMYELKGCHLRILDEFTFSILNDYIKSLETAWI